MATGELHHLRGDWPRVLLVLLIRYLQNLERKEIECNERFGCTQSGNCKHCGKYILTDFEKHISFCHLELAWLCCCLVMWCMMWRWTTRDCREHIRRMHQMPSSVRPANLANIFPAWISTREQWASISGWAVDTLFFSRMASPLGYRYWLISPTGIQSEVPQKPTGLTGIAGSSIPVRSDDGDVPPGSNSIAGPKVGEGNVPGWPTGPPVAIFSVDDFQVVFGVRYIRQVVRRRASPPGGRTVGAAHDYHQHEPPAPVVDLVTGKCKWGIVSRPVFTSPLTLDMTVVCTSRVKVPPPWASTQVVLTPATVASTVTAIGTSTPFVATPAPVLEQPGMQAKKFQTLRLLESPKLLPSFGLLFSSPSPTLPWGAAEDSSPPFLPNRVQVGRSQAVPDEDSSFSVSPLSPGLFFRPPRGSTSPPAGGVLLPTTLDDFDDSVLGDPITYARCEQFPVSESPFSLPVWPSVWPSVWPFSSTSDCVLHSV